MYIYKLYLKPYIRLYKPQVKMRRMPQLLPNRLSSVRRGHSAPPSITHACVFPCVCTLLAHPCSVLFLRFTLVLSGVWMAFFFHPAIQESYCCLMSP